MTFAKFMSWELKLQPKTRLKCNFFLKIENEGACEWCTDDKLAGWEFQLALKKKVMTATHPCTAFHFECTPPSFVHGNTHRL